ncbi:hypothetical protein D3C80_1534140 [compost metagenome]
MFWFMVECSKTSRVDFQRHAKLHQVTEIFRIVESRLLNTDGKALTWIGNESTNTLTGFHETLVAQLRNCLADH